MRPGTLVRPRNRNTLRWSDWHHGKEISFPYSIPDSILVVLQYAPEDVGVTDGAQVLASTGEIFWVRCDQLEEVGDEAG